MIDMQDRSALRTVLIVCTGNSCRSVMAEGLVNHMGEGRYSAVSAGSNPTGFVHPKSLEILQKHGIAMNNPRSKSWSEFSDQYFDTVITVCDQAVGESCPVFLGPCKKLHWSTPDPGSVKGSEEAMDAAFEEVFQKLKKRIESELL